MAVNRVSVKDAFVMEERDGCVQFMHVGLMGHFQRVNLSVHTRCAGDLCNVANSISIRIA